MGQDVQIKETRARCARSECNGIIMEKWVHKFVGYGSPIIGPGGKNQWADVSEGYFCKECGIKYEFPPGNKEISEENVHPGRS